MLHMHSLASSTVQGRVSDGYAIQLGGYSNAHGGYA